MDPITTALVMTFAGSALSAQGEYDSGKSQEDAYRFQSSIERLRAEQDDERATEEEAAASRRAAEQYRIADLKSSSARARGAASGSDTSAGDIMKSITQWKEYGTREALTTLKEGRSIASQYRKQAASRRIDADNLRWQGGAAFKQGQSRRNAAIITGGGNFLANV